MTAKQLTLVVVARAEAEPWARADLVLDLAHAPHVVVLAQAGRRPWWCRRSSEELGVGPLDVIALVEGVEGTDFQLAGMMTVR